MNFRVLATDPHCLVAVQQQVASVMAQLVNGFVVPTTRRSQLCAISAQPFALVARTKRIEPTAEAVSLEAILHKPMRGPHSAGDGIQQALCSIKPYLPGIFRHNRRPWRPSQPDLCKVTQKVFSHFCYSLFACWLGFSIVCFWMRSLALKLLTSESKVMPKYLQ